MKKLFHTSGLPDGFGSGCFGVIALMVIIPVVIYLVL